MIDYIHRVGRTGRADSKGGRAITFFTNEDKPMLRSLGNLLKLSGCEVSDWILKLKKLSKSKKKKLEKFPVKRENISQEAKYQKSNDKEFCKLLKMK